MKELAQVLTAEFGKGFSRANLQNIFNFRIINLCLSKCAVSF